MIKYKTAIIGFGKLGILYSSLCNIHNLTNLSFIVEPNFLIRFFLKKRLKNVEILKNINELTSKEIDIIFITTPNFSHFEICKFFLQKFNTNVFVEKPLTISLNECKKLSILSKNKNVKVQVGYMFRYCKTYLETKKIIESKQLGNIKSFKCTMFSSQVFKETDNWRFKKNKAGGGVLITQNSHLIDLMIWFFGMPKSINAETKNIYSKEVEDEVNAEFTYDSFRGMLETSWSKEGYRNLVTNIEIQFDKGSIKVDEDELEIKDNLIVKKINKISSFTPNFYDLAGDYYSSQFNSFIDSIENNIKNTNDIDDSLNIHNVIETVYLSSNQKKRIKLDENIS